MKRINTFHQNDPFKILIILSFIFLIISFKFILVKRNSNSNKINFHKYDELYKQEIKLNDNSICHSLDPIQMFNIRLKNVPFDICNGKNSKHRCFTNHEGYYNDISFFENGLLCTIENIVLDPSKFKKPILEYNGPIDYKNKGRPILYKGFFNANCFPNRITFKYNIIYKEYFNSWNYYYNLDKKLEVLSPGKTILLISRNQDSPNLFHGNSEIINVICILYLFNLKPEDVQVLIYSGIEIKEDPFYEIYRDMISRGGEPLYVKNLKKKYIIKKAINVPINLDSPSFINVNVPKCDKITRTYKIYNDLVDKYMNLKPFKDTFYTDNISIYYPDKTIKNHIKGIKFLKRVIIQWRKVWPKGRKGQKRILSNAINLTKKLAEALPSNILIILIDTATLSFKEQISLMRDTDYLVGIHGAGLSLSIFLPKNSILHEICNKKHNKLLTIMSSLSGHKTYSDILKNYNYTDKNGNINVVFDENSFVERIMAHMKENDFFKE